MHIILENLVYSGIHGLTQKEQLAPQRLRTDISITPWDPALREMIDYRIAKNIAKAIIEGEHHTLIETIAERIASQILTDMRIRSIKVSIRKLDIWENGVPGVEITRHASPPRNLLDFDIEHVIYELLFRGGVSFPILPEIRRKKLVEEAELCTYEKQPEVVGNHNVREQLSSCKTPKKDGRFIELKKDVTEILNYKLSLLPNNPFESSFITFNEISIQRYEKDSLGITPHVDNFSCKNLVLVFLLKGKGDFFLCDNRDGVNPKALDTSIGNMIILRAPGFFGSTVRPFHFVTNITEERITFGLRHNIHQ